MIKPSITIIQESPLKGKICDTPEIAKEIWFDDLAKSAFFDSDKEHLIEAVPSWIRYVAVARRLASLCGLLLGPGRVFIDSTSRWITEINVSTPWFLSLRGKNLADFMRLEMEALRTFRRRNLLHAIPFVHLRLLDACHRSDTVDEALFRHVEEEADSVTAQHGDADASGPMQRNGDQSTGGQHHLYEIAKRSLIPVP